MKTILFLLTCLCFVACRKEALPKKTTPPAEEIRVMVYATNGSDTTPVASTSILRLSLK